MMTQPTSDGSRSASTDSMTERMRPIDRLTARLSRRSVFAVGGLAGIGLVASQLDLLRSAAQESAEIQSLIDPLATLEALSVTLIGVGRQQGDAMKIGTNPSRFLRAAQCEDEAHYHFLTGAGATPGETFTIDDRLFRSRDTFLAALMELKEMTVGATMAASRQFASLGELGLVEIAYQMGTTEAQHLALARYARGEQIANDRAFAKWRFAHPGESVQSIQDAGYLDGKGDRYDFPGPLSRQCRGVFGLVPETSDDQFPPLGSPVASPAADG